MQEAAKDAAGVGGGQQIPHGEVLRVARHREETARQY